MGRTERTPPPGRPVLVEAAPGTPTTPVRRPVAAFGPPSPPSGASYSWVVQLGQQVRGKRQVRVPGWQQGFEVYMCPKRRLQHSPPQSAEVGVWAVASDFFSQPGEAAAEPLRREEGRVLGESQELLDRTVPLLGKEQVQEVVLEEEVQPQKIAEVEVRQEGGLHLQG